MNIDEAFGIVRQSMLRKQTAEQDLATLHEAQAILSEEYVRNHFREASGADLVGAVIRRLES